MGDKETPSEAEANSAKADKGLEDAAEYGICGQTYDLGKSVQGVEWSRLPIIGKWLYAANRD